MGVSNESATTLPENAIRICITFSRSWKQHIQLNIASAGVALFHGYTIGWSKKTSLLIWLVCLEKDYYQKYAAKEVTRAAYQHNKAIA